MKKRTDQEEQGLKIGGLQRFSLLDYPGRPSAVVFTSGCNFRCPWCHNGELALGKAQLISADAVVDFLRERQGLLGAVTFSGGEPTIQSELSPLMRKAKGLDYLIKLDTNGSRPDRLRGLLEGGLVDYVAMDVKAPPEKYPAATGVEPDLAKIEQSIGAIKGFKGGSEFRTTAFPGLKKEDLLTISEWIGDAEKYTLQEFKAPEDKRLLDPEYERTVRERERTPLGKKELEEAAKEMETRFGKVEVR